MTTSQVTELINPSIEDKLFITFKPREWFEENAELHSLSWRLKGFSLDSINRFGVADAEIETGCFIHIQYLEKYRWCLDEVCTVETHPEYFI